MRPILIVNPRSDEEFVRETHRIVEEGVESAIEMQRALRERYPAATVRERLLEGETPPTWYVYREGLWIPNET